MIDIVLCQRFCFRYFRVCVCQCIHGDRPLHNTPQWNVPDTLITDDEIANKNDPLGVAVAVHIGSADTSVAHSSGADGCKQALTSLRSVPLLLATISWHCLWDLCFHDTTGRIRFCPSFDIIYYKVTKYRGTETMVKVKTGK